ncbi:MAG TPA: glycyl-radical enzyme activating protein [Verrucomicrobiota bacterium]|nr:glycyl-radical enzyme activating protein [Verrucomicrobiota bacterium]
MSALLTHIQHYCLQDGPGIRTTVFFKGCPLQCRWCHNPEAISPEPEVLLSEDKCVRCGECFKPCFHQSVRNLSRARCPECHYDCPTLARQISGTRYTVEALLKEILRDRLFYEESRGGVTLSGGEPLLQADFLRKFLPELKREEISVALDTCGFAPEEDFSEIALQCSLILFDLKMVSPELHLQYTGRSNELILQNLESLSRRADAPRLWLRIPVIPGVNDSEAEIEALLKKVKSLGGIEQINLLPYHKVGLEKYERLDRRFLLKGLEAPSVGMMESLLARFQEVHPRVKICG